MTSSRWLWCWLVALAVAPLWAQRPGSNAPPHSTPEGSTFLVRLEDKLDASRIQPGKRFKARLAEELIGPDELRLLPNTRVKGHVSSVNNGLRPRLRLSFDEIETERGWVPLIATVTAVPGEHGLQASGEEGEIERKGSTSRREEGSSEGGDKNRPGVAAAANVVGALFSDRRLQLQKGTMLELRLDRPIQMPGR